MPDDIEPFYIARGDGRFDATIHTQGAWNPNEQHMAPVSGILTHCLQQFQPRPELRMARLSFDILGLIPSGTFTISTSMLRAGRTIELVQAELIADGRTAVRATAWRLLRTDTADIAAIEDKRMQGPDVSGNPAPLEDRWDGGFIRAIEVWTVGGHSEGRGRAWIRTTHPLVNQPFSDLARLIGLVDTSNGIAVRVHSDPGGFAFPNVDLQIHMYREPTGEWLGLENSVSFGTDGIGLTSTVLHDDVGPFGRAEQILTLRRIP